MKVNQCDLEVGFDVPALIGMDEKDIQTPCLVVDLDAFERNVEVMRKRVEEMGVTLRVHGKMHKSVDVAKFQMEAGGAVGVCCQKVSEAEAFVRGGILDVLLSNEVRNPIMIDRLARLPNDGARILCCVDAVENVGELSDAAVKHGTKLECLVEIECGAERCGVRDLDDVVVIAKAINDAPGLSFSGIQAYQGAMQHLETFDERKAAFSVVANRVRQTIELLNEAGFNCEIVTGAGTGSYYLEGQSGLYTELQCGSYAYMDADYGRVLDKNGDRFDKGEFENALFLLTSIMSNVASDRAICDAGLKVQSIDSGNPTIFGREDIHYSLASDEHGVILDPNNTLRINEKLKLIPGHCDPTCNIHDYYVGVRNGKVEALWPVTARGKAF